MHVRHCMAATLLLLLGLSSSPAVGVEFERLDFQEDALTQRSAGDIAAMTSDCLETWAYHQQNIDEDALETAFNACHGNALKKFEPLPVMPDNELAPLVSGPDGRGLECTLPTWGCRATTRCPRPWSPRILCRIDHCGTGTCPSCPNLWGNILINSWCSYKCTLDDKVVGGAFEMKTRFGGYLGPVCLGR